MDLGHRKPATEHRNAYMAGGRLGPPPPAPATFSFEPVGEPRALDGVVAESVRWSVSVSVWQGFVPVLGWTGWSWCRGARLAVQSPRTSRVWWLRLLSAAERACGAWRAPGPPRLALRPTGPAVPRGVFEVRVSTPPGCREGVLVGITREIPAPRARGRRPNGGRRPLAGGRCQAAFCSRKYGLTMCRTSEASAPGSSLSAGREPPRGRIGSSPVHGPRR